ncbi:hypothetical protein BGW41_004551 [Actinomortierella wolfii]|nr:hypothetical protein BGW41_004551 [Actinomortierella wolfii]
MKFCAIIATLFAAAIASAQDVPSFTHCEKLSDEIVPQLTIEQFTIAPYPLCIGQSVCATGKGQLSTPVIEGAQLSITGKFLGRIVYTDNYDLCTLMANQGHPCPIPTTLTSLTSCINVKPNAPADINVKLEVMATNGDGNLLFCQEANVIAKKC